MAVLDQTVGKDERRELFLYVQNTGAMYPDLCQIARVEDIDGRTRIPLSWVTMATKGARLYEKEFGTGEALFNSATILAVAVDLAEYYHQHIAEGA